MQADASMSMRSAGAESSGTKDFANTKNLASTEELRTTVREGMSLIDRFYDGGNRARPEALDILVVVLDSVVRGMRQQRDTRRLAIEDCQGAIATIDSQIAMIRPKQAALRKELDEKRALSASLSGDITHSTTSIKDSIENAKQALHRAKVVTRVCESKQHLERRTAEKGYDHRGCPLPGRDVNLRKNPNGPAARKAGDMLKDIKLK